MSPRLTLLAAAAALAATPGLAKPASAIRVSGAWTRPVAKGQNDAGYVTLTNTGRTSDRLVGVASPQAGKAEMHLSETVNDISRMKAVAGGLELKPGETVRFEPGGYHIMFEDLKGEEKLGSALPVVLTFAKAGRLKVAFKVAAGPPP